MTHKLKPLDGRAFQILMFIYNYKEAHDYSPSNREMCVAIQTTNSKPISLSVLNWHLKALRKKYGYLDYVPRQSRTVHLTREGKDFVAAFILPEKIKQAKMKIDQLKTQLTKT